MTTILLWLLTNAEYQNFELLVFYLKELKECNAGSIIGYPLDDNKYFKNFHVFPRFMNGSLHFVGPVVSLDAAHVTSTRVATLYVASVLSGAN
jgi:hypothetical protein